MDWSNLTLTALIAFGVVNVIDIFKPKLDSRIKFGLSAAAALIVGFVPANLGNVILTHLKDAIYAATAASGAYKLFTKAGGK